MEKKKASIRLSTGSDQMQGDSAKHNLKVARYMLFFFVFDFCCGCVVETLSVPYLEGVGSGCVASRRRFRRLIIHAQSQLAGPGSG